MEIPVLKIGKMSFYQFMITLAIVMGFIYLICQKQYSVKQKITVAITSIISGFIGARLLYALVNYKTVTIDQIFAFKFSFFKGYGALILVVINIIVLSKIYKIKLSKTLEQLITWFFIGGAMAKIGCLFTGCCRGKATNMPWAVHKKYDIVGAHPSALYDSLAFVFSLLLLKILKKLKIKDSTRIAISLMVYVILRGIIEVTYYNGALFGKTIAERVIYGITIMICIGVIAKNLYADHFKPQNIS